MLEVRDAADGKWVYPDEPEQGGVSSSSAGTTGFSNGGVGAGSQLGVGGYYGGSSSYGLGYSGGSSYNNYYRNQVNG